MLAPIRRTFHRCLVILLFAWYVSLTPDVFAQDTGNDRLPTGAVARIGSLRFRHVTPVIVGTFSPDGRLVATAGEQPERYCRVWDAASGKELFRLPDSDVQALTFSFDGQLLATASGYFEQDVKRIRVWSLATGTELVKFEEHKRTISALAISPDRQSLAAAGADGALLVWDLPTAKLRHTLPGQAGMVRAVVFSPDGKVLASAGGEPMRSHEHLIDLWDVKTGKDLHRLAGHECEVSTLAFSPDSKLLASGVCNLFNIRAAGDTRVWKVDSGKELPALDKRAGSAERLAFSADGKQLYAVDDKARVRSWNLGTRKEAASVTLADSSVSRLLAISQDARTVAVGHGSLVKLIDVATGKHLHPTDYPANAARALAFAPDGKHLAIGSSPVSFLWNVKDRKSLRKLKTEEESPQAVAFSADGKLLATWEGNTSETLRLWETATGKELWTRHSPGTALSQLRFSPDGKWLAVMGKQSSIFLVDVERGTLRSSWLSFNDGAFPPFPLAFIPQSDTLLIGTPHGISPWLYSNVREVFDGNEFRLQRSRANGLPTALAHSPDCRLLATGTRDGWLRVSEVAGGLEIIQLKSPEDKTATSQGVWAAAFSADGRFLAGGCGDSSVRVWEVATWKERKKFIGHDGMIHALTFSPDGTTLVSSAGDTLILVWDVADLSKSPSGFKALARGEFENRWDELANLDPRKAHQAFHRLAEDPQETTKRVKQYFQATDERTAALREFVADLIAGDFKKREAAARELSADNLAAVPVLEAALKGKLTLEGKRRVEALVKQLTPFKQQPYSGEDLRLLRSISLLERIGNPAAIDLVQALAKNSPAPILTLQAQATLHRLQKK